MREPDQVPKTREEWHKVWRRRALDPSRDQVDHSPPDFSSVAEPPPEKIEAFKRELERERQQEAVERVQRDCTKAAASERNRLEMEHQARAGPHPDTLRKIKEARARAAKAKGNAETSKSRAPEPSGADGHGQPRKAPRKGRRKAKPPASPPLTAADVEADLPVATASAADILRYVARVAWIRNRPGEECPETRIPSPTRLAEWLPTLYPPDERGAGFPPALWLAIIAEHAGNLALSGAPISPPKEPPDVASAMPGAIEQMHRQASTMELLPLVDTWQRMDPERVRMIYDKPTLIIPRTVAHVEATAERYYLARFGPAVHREPDGQLLMGFAEEGERGPTLPANVWTMGLSDAEKRGAVVPLELRIWVAAILHTPLHARHGNYPVLFDDLTLRKFLRWGYVGKRLPRPSRYWRRLLDARDVINATELPFEYPVGSGNLWARPVVMLPQPLTIPGLDDPWPTTVHLPPGDGIGPALSFARVQYWSVRNAACFRALINLAYRWHIEGKRLMPAPGSNHWLQRRVPKLYDRITDADAEALCFPPGTGATRRDQRIGDARDSLEKLVKAGDAVSIDGRLLPPASR